MKEEFEQRLTELLSEGKELFSNLPANGRGFKYWIPEDEIPEYQQWIGSVANLIKLIDQPNGLFISEYHKIINDLDFRPGIPSRAILKIYGLLSSFQEEWKHGFLRKIEHILIAEAFDDFLDHASVYHKGLKFRTPEMV